jgi:hypothetical protein
MPRIWIPFPRRPSLLLPQHVPRLQPGKPSKKCVEVFLDESAVSIMHSLGIRIATEKALFGYDFPKLTEFGRNRSQISRLEHLHS